MELTSFPVDRLVRPENAPVGALMLTSWGHVVTIASTSSVYFPGETESRLLWDYVARGDWAILSSAEHELMLPAAAVQIFEHPDPHTALEGVGANGRGVNWEETNRQDYWNNSWEWFGFHNDEPLTDAEITYPVSVWEA